MKNLFPVFKYFGIFILIYASLYSLVSLPAVVVKTNETYRAITEPLLQSIFPKAYLELEPDSPPESDPHTFRAVFISKTEIEAAKATAKKQGTSKVDIKAREYDIYLHLMFTTFWIFLIALILITPLKIKQKLIALLVGSLIFFAYTFFKVFIFLLDVFNKSAFDMYKLSETGGNIVGKISYVLKSPGLSAFIIVFIWVLVAFRKSNWKDVLKKVGG